MSAATVTNALEAFIGSHPPEDAGCGASSDATSFSAHLNFYNHHVDRSLNLAKVVPLPVDRLTAYARVYLHETNTSHLPPVREGYFPDLEAHLATHRRTKDPSASHLATQYANQTSRFCGIVASTLHSPPRIPAWKSIFRWSQITDSETGPFLNDCFGIAVGSSGLSFDAWPCLSEEDAETLKISAEYSPAACIFQFLERSPKAEQLLNEMGSSGSALPIRPRSSPAITGFKEPAIVSWGDEDNSTIIKTLVSGLSEALDSPDQKHAIPPSRTPRHTKRKRAGKLPTVKVNDSHAASATAHISNNVVAASLLRRAWARAAANNSSFIVWNCGRFERIGVRDRETRTLYLTDPIEVYKDSDPSYYLIHTGLHLAMLDDVLQRSVKHTNFKVRQVPLVDGYGLKTRSQQRIISEIQTRDLALVILKYDAFNSPSPSAFMRLKAEDAENPDLKSEFAPTQYLVLTIGAEISRGGTGIVHDANLDLFLEKSLKRSYRVVVKLAFTGQQCTRLRREKTIYDRLSEFLVAGVPRVYGLFQDTMTGALAMVMDHAGSNLYTLHKEAYRQPDGPRFPQALRRQFMQILADIHEAGVVHRDIRPENLTLDGKGNAYILDFDRARLNPTDEQKEDDREDLDGVLDGERVGGRPTPTASTRASSSVKTDATP